MKSENLKVSVLPGKVGRVRDLDGTIEFDILFFSCVVMWCRDCLLDVYGREAGEYPEEEVFGSRAEAGCRLLRHRRKNG